MVANDTVIVWLAVTLTNEYCNVTPTLTPSTLTSVTW